MNPKLKKSSSCGASINTYEYPPKPTQIFLHDSPKDSAEKIQFYNKISEALQKEATIAKKSTQVKGRRARGRRTRGRRTRGRRARGRRIRGRR